MEKLYKVKFYYIDKYNSMTDSDLYTKKEIIQYINDMTGTNSKTVNEASIALRQSKNWDIKTIYREITNDDIVGNIKPDNSFTNKLEFGEFKNIINKDEYINTKFSTLTKKQKFTVCIFIDKNIKLLQELKEENQNKPEIICKSYINLLNDFVYEMFLATDKTEAEFMINQMAIFNNVENDKLINVLNHIIENMTVKQLLSKEEEFLDPISNEFWNKIVEENNKKEKDLTNE